MVSGLCTLTACMLTASISQGYVASLRTMPPVATHARWRHANQACFLIGVTLLFLLATIAAT